MIVNVLINRSLTVSTKSRHPDRVKADIIDLFPFYLILLPQMWSFILRASNVILKQVHLNGGGEGASNKSGKGDCGHGEIYLSTDIIAQSEACTRPVQDINAGLGVS